MVNKRILWLDDDPPHVESHIEALRRAGHEVELAKTVTEAKGRLEHQRYDLLILDVMIPTDESEEGEFPPSETEWGRDTGLAFYRRLKDRLGQQGTKVLVTTIRRDQEILQAFKKEGLPEDCFAPKLSYRTPRSFAAKVNEVLDPS